MKQENYQMIRKESILCCISFSSFHYRLMRGWEMALLRKRCCSPVKLKNIIMMHNDVKAQSGDKAQFDDNVQFDVNLQFDVYLHHKYLKYVGFYVKRR